MALPCAAQALRYPSSPSRPLGRHHVHLSIVLRFRFFSRFAWAVDPYAARLVRNICASDVDFGDIAARPSGKVHG
jgi:hypothetical protein